MNLFNPLQNLSFLKSPPIDWTAKSFNDIFTDISGGNRKIQKSDFLTDGNLAIIDQGQNLIAGFTNDLDARCNADAQAIVFGDHTKSLKYTSFPFAMGADGTKVLKTT